MLREARPTNSACSAPNQNHMSKSWFLHSLSLSLSAPSSCYRLSATPHPGKKRGSFKIQKHMWLAIKLHMHSVDSSPPSNPHTPIPALPTDTHIDLQGGRKDVHEKRNNRTRGSNIGQQSEPSVAASKNKGVWGVWWWDSGDSQKEGDCRLPFQHGPRTMPILWLGGAALCAR